ncbi:MAG TPA: septum site-determining protein MinD [Candidatus Eremiobacteraceae bacterium]|nr:septum site-determining protein MinD [Candidatus Eremiobacteraceae bacterium]
MMPDVENERLELPHAADGAAHTGASAPEVPAVKKAVRLGRSIVVTSGKGGVGKTTTTANLGTALADAGRSVVVVDADVGLRNLDVVLGLENRVSKHLLDVIEGKCSLDDALVRDRVRRNLQLLPAAQNREKDDVPEDKMADLVGQLRERFEFVLIDCPAGIEQGFRNAVIGAQEAVVVTTPEVSAVRDADRIVGLLPQEIVIKLVVNRVRPAMVRKGTMMSVADVNAILRLDLIGVVPDEREIIIATNRGTPVIDIDGSETGAAFRRIARRLLGEAIPIPPFEDKGSFFSRFMTTLGVGRS